MAGARRGIGRLDARGLAARGYVALWSAALALALIAPGYGAWLGFTRAPAWTPYGVTTEFHFREILEVFGAEARAAGIAPGDRVVAIDDVPMARIGPARGAVRRALARHPGDAITLTLRRGPTGAATRHLLHWRAANVAEGERLLGRLGEGGSRTATAIGLIQALILVGAAALLFGRRRDRVAATFSMSLLLIAGSYGVAEAGFYEFGLFSTQLVLAFTAYGVLMLGLFTFPGGKLEPRWTAVAALLVPVWAVTGFFVNDVKRPMVALEYVGLGALALLAIQRRYRRFATDAERQQVRWFLLGLAAFLGCVIVQMSLFTRGNVIGGPSGRTLWEWGRVFALLATVAFNGGLVVSLLRYRLYDADTAIGRSVTYGALTLGLLAIFAGSEKIVEVLGEEYFGESLGALAGGLGAAAAAVMIAPLHHRIGHWAEHRFQKNLLRLRRELPLLAGDLRETASAERIAEAALDEIAGGLRAARAALLIGDGAAAARGVDAAAVARWRDDWRVPARAGLDCDRADALFPVRVPLDASGHGRVGWLLVGPRPDGSFYNRDERAADRARLDAALAGLARRLASVERRIAAPRAVPSV